jgi:hypothetical protein
MRIGGINLYNTAWAALGTYPLTLIVDGTVACATSTNITAASRLAVRGHILSQQATEPTIAGTTNCNVNIGSGYSFPQATDTSGQIVIQPIATGAVVATITFHTAYTNIPNVILTASSSYSAMNNFYIVATVNGFKVYFTAIAGQVGHDCTYGYMVIETSA